MTSSTRAKKMVSTTPPSEESKESRSQATLLVALALRQSTELFHTPSDEAFITLPAGGHLETWPLQSREFRHWLRHIFYEAVERAPSSQAANDALATLEGRALFEGRPREVFTRLAGVGRYIYLDIANDRWETVKISEEGWSRSSDPVKFRRTRGMLHLPHPETGGTIEELRQFVNVVNDNDWALLLAWLIAALRPTGPYPIIALHGEQASGKSMLARILRSLVDPNRAPLRSAPRDPHDLMISATNSWLLAFDNLSHLPVWLSDALCQLSTGAGFATRELYTDSDEVIFDAQRPIILNGIEDLAVRGDLLDRTIPLYLPPIAPTRRRTEQDFWEAFAQAKPRILGALLDAVVQALRNVPSVKLDTLPRMADFAMWATAAESALRLSKGSFMEAYSANREATNELALEASPVVPLIRELANEGGFQGTATELFRHLEEVAGYGELRQKGWPGSVRTLTNTLRRLAVNLRAVGIQVEFWREAGSNSRRMVTIRNEDATSVAKVAPDADEGARAGSSASHSQSSATIGDACDESSANTSGVHPDASSAIPIPNVDECLELLDD